MKEEAPMKEEVKLTADSGKPAESCAVCDTKTKSIGTIKNADGTRGYALCTDHLKEDTVRALFMKKAAPTSFDVPKLT